MTEISDLEGTDLYLALCRRRVAEWEKAGSLRRENEAAEAFTRAFAELDVALRDGGDLPGDWAGARPPDVPEGEATLLDAAFGGHTVLVGPDGPASPEETARLRREAAELRAEVQRLKAELDMTQRRNVLLVPAVHMPAAMEASMGEEDGTVIRATDDPGLEFELKDGAWLPRR